MVFMLKRLLRELFSIICGSVRLQKWSLHLTLILGVLCCDAGGESYNQTSSAID